MAECVADSSVSKMFGTRPVLREKVMMILTTPPRLPLSPLSQWLQVSACSTSVFTIVAGTLRSPEGRSTGAPSSATSTLVQRTLLPLKGPPAPTNEHASMTDAQWLQHQGIITDKSNGADRDDQSNGRRASSRSNTKSSWGSLGFLRTLSGNNYDSIETLCLKKCLHSLDQQLRLT